MSSRLHHLVLAAALAFAGSAAADGAAAGRPWSAIDAAGLLRAIEGAPTVVLADLQAERARLAAVAAGAVVGGTVRTGGEAAWRAEAAGPSAPAGWDAGLGAITLSTTWYLIPSGPTHAAATRAVRGHELALEASSEARRDAILDALDQIVSLERLDAQAALAEARLGLARRSRDATLSQAAAGTASAAALAEAELAVTQAEGELIDVLADDDAAGRAFARAVGTTADALWAPPEAPLAGLLHDAVAVAAPGALAVDRDEVEAAIAASARVAEATRDVDDAVDALLRARRDAGVTVSLSARVAGGGVAGRWSAGAAWDTRSRQPGLDLSIDPFDPTASPTTATIGANLSVPFGVATGATVAQAEVDEALALSRWQQASASAALDLETAVRAAEQADRALRLARDRLDLRTSTLASVEARAILGAASPLDHERARLDALEAALAVLRAADHERGARTRLESMLGRTPSFTPIAALLGAVPSEVP